MFYRRIFDLPNWGDRRPFSDLDRLRNQMDKLYGALSGEAFPKLAAGVFPLTNVTEDGENFYVRAELPGIKSNELDIQDPKSNYSCYWIISFFMNNSKNLRAGQFRPLSGK